jgi:hypothetical protein
MQGVFEIKFLVPNSLADSLLEVVRRYLPADEHCEPGLQDAYQVSSLYFDTPDWEVYYQSGFHRRRKFRLRRYGHVATIWAERKRKVAGEVSKRRSHFADSELVRLNGEVPSADWPGRWFAERIRRRGLEPTCLVGYRRIARVALTGAGPIRFTVDREMQCRAAEKLAVDPLVGGCKFLAGRSIVEMKFQANLPALFKQLMIDYCLTPQPISKFRFAVESLGLIRLPSAKDRQVQSPNSPASSTIAARE